MTATLGCLWLALAATVVPRPNVLLILADDLGYNQVGCYGADYTFYRTPRIDALAAEGMRFTQAYAACPVCSPTRASLLTGQYPARLHLTDFIPGNAFPHARLRQPDWRKFLPLEAVTLAECLRDLGYRTGAFGKWHLSVDKRPPRSLPFNPDRQGFDEHLVTYKPTRNQDPEADAHNVARITERSLRFLREHRDQPFFLYVAHNTVHDPLKERAGRIAPYRREPAASRPENNPTLAAMIETLDASTGRILDALARLDLTAETIVIFFSDNGGLERSARQTPLRAGKANLYEGGIRVPLIVRWPGRVRAASRCDTPVSSVDVLPTILDLVGAAARTPAPCDGLSWRPLLRETGPLAERALYWHYPHYHGNNQLGPSAAIRAGDLKLIRTYDETRGPAVQLYDLSRDLGETRDLAAARPDDVMRLRRRLEAWQVHVGAQLPAPNPHYDPQRAEGR